MQSLNSSRPRRAVDRRRALVWLAVVALRRTAFENSARLLAAGVTLVLLADGARRVDAPGALDRWLVAALTVAVVLPVAISSNDPLRSPRLALLPLPSRVLSSARVIASAPLRLPLAALLLIVGSVPTSRVTSIAAVFTLVGWGIAAFFAGAVLEEFWHRPRAIYVRAIAVSMAAFGAWCLWSLRSAAQSVTASGPLSWIPALLPRESSTAGWLIALTALTLSVAFGMVVLRAPWGQGSKASALPATARAVMPWHGVHVTNGTSFPRAVRPVVAHEIALLLRHVGSRISLALVSVLACAATYGRVPGLALVAISPMIILAANMLGADVPLGGLTRYRLRPSSLASVRDRRLTVWGVCAAVAAVPGAIAGAVLPPPLSVGQPTGGAFGAPAMLFYAITLIPWFGRASWWWARRYPQPLARRVYEVGAPTAMGPAGPAHLALALLAAWAGVALLATLLRVASREVVHALATAVSFGEMPVTAMDEVSSIGAALLAGGVAAVSHVVLSAMSPRAAATKIVVGAEATR